MINKIKQRTTTTFAMEMTLAKENARHKKHGRRLEGNISPSSKPKCRERTGQKSEGKQKNREKIKTREKANGLK